MLDAATSAFIDQMARYDIKPIHTLDVEQARAFGAVLKERYGLGPGMARVEDRVLTSDDDASFVIRILVPVRAPRGVIVFYHGGGWVIGDMSEYDTLARYLAHGTGCAVALVNYRLAPEHPFPAAIDDAYTALVWVAEHLTRLAHPGAPIIIAGDSAGGNLAAVTAQRARDRCGPDIALQLLVYPVADADLWTASYLDPANQLLLSRDTMVWFWAHYLPCEAQRKQPDASPLRAKKLSGLPPTILILAEHDPLLDEGKAYAERLSSAGVCVDCRCFAGQMHGFFNMLNVLPKSEKAVAYAVAAINAKIGSGGTLDCQWRFGAYHISPAH